ncbi:MAG: hypothetical protein K8R89_04050 [Anaerolineae bacterium]|nr:hypothetical protein [Anaerolineae bacterium]
MKLKQNYLLLLLVIILLLLTALACNLFSPAPPTETLESEVGDATATTSPLVGEVEPTPSLSPAPTDTPVPDAAGPGGCTLNGVYVADVTIPYDSEFPPGAAFNKVWRVRNSGTCTWEAGTQLIFVSGASLGGPAAMDVAAVAPDTNTDIGVDLAAPVAPGTYRSTWQLQSPEGVRFGSQIYVQIIVPEPVTETSTPTTEPTVTPTEEVSVALPDLVITHLEVDTSDPRQNVPLHIVATLRNQGGSVAENFHWAWRVCTHAGCEYTEAPGSFTLVPGEEIVAQLEYLFGGYATYTTEAWVDSREEVVESDEANNIRQLQFTVHAAPATEATLHYVSSRSGNLSSGGRSSDIKIGIAPAGNGIRAFLDFDLSELDGLRDSSTIQAATLDLSNYSGDCFEFLHPFLVQHVNYGSQRDYPADYSSAPLDTLLSASSASGINSPVDIRGFVRAFVHGNGAAHLQLRLQLDGDDAGSAYSCLMTWPDPVLNITYQP